MIRKATIALLLMALGALSGCEDEPEIVTPPAKPLQGELELELRDSAATTVERTSGDSIRVTITASAGYGLLPAGQALVGDGYLESLSEASATLYTAKLAAPAQNDGPCGAEPVSLALSLHRPGQSDTVLGGISAYCGADVWYGVPVRVLRLSGELR